MNYMINNPFSLKKVNVSDSKNDSKSDKPAFS